MTRLAGVVMLLCNDVARAAGLRPGSSTDPAPLPGSSVPPDPESPYPSYADAHALGPPMRGAAGSSYAGSPSDTETGTEDSRWAGTGGSYMHKMYAAAGRPPSPPGSPPPPRRAPRSVVPQLPHLHDAPQTDVNWVTELEAIGWPNFLVLPYSKTPGRKFLGPAAPPDEEPHAQQTENTDATGQVVVRAALNGDVKSLPAIPQETIQALRVRLAAAYPETFGDLSTHVNFWRDEANDAVVDEASPSEEEAVDRADVDSSAVSGPGVGFLRGDDLVFRGSANGTTVLKYVKAGVFEGLEKWLKEVGLEKYLTEANAWLHERQRSADDYTAIFEQLPAFCDALKMKLLNKKALKMKLRRRINAYMEEAGRPERC